MVDQDDIRIAYQGAIEMASHEGEAVWARFNVILVANSIVLLALTTSTNTLPPNSGIVLPVGGIVLCVMWLFLMKRGFTYEKYYVVTARLLEQRLANGSIRTLSSGMFLSEGKLVKIEDEKIQMSPLARLNARGIVYAAIGVFVAAYVFFCAGRWNR
jgi:hypothetical protein